MSGPSILNLSPSGDSKKKKRSSSSTRSGVVKSAGIKGAGISKVRKSRKGRGSKATFKGRRP
jgi:hypothetical protein